MNKYPKVSVIIPCRNEKKFIAECLDSILRNNYPKKYMEILIVDGMSEDGTQKIITNYLKKYNFIRLLNNPNLKTPFALNIGIKNSTGQIIIRLDAHAVYDSQYISKCVFYLNQFQADNVGGIVKTVPQNSSLVAKSIAKTYSQFFGTGNSFFRIGSEKIKIVDTVFGGCFPKSIFDRIGLFNEKLIRSQDIEFNIRIKKAGGKIYLFPDIISYYYPQSNLRDFFIHNLNDGIWSVYPLRFTSVVFSVRHYLPFAFVFSLSLLLTLAFLNSFFWHFLIFILIVYLIFLIYFSIKIAWQEKSVVYLATMPLCFFIRHFSYGIGSFIGIIKLIK